MSEQKRTDLVHVAIDEEVVAGGEVELGVGVLVRRVLDRVIAVLGDEYLERLLEADERHVALMGFSSGIAPVLPPPAQAD